MIDVRDDGDILVRQHGWTTATAALTLVFARGTANVLDMMIAVCGSHCLYAFILATAVVSVAVLGRPKIV